ncbi:methyl-accepting chemotaxis protein [Geminocystis sp. GBBB08]|uniref:methyl-accepting chemotaxis protein n=1 Tax=Geminocystis sp. GBBB08 TaxID=2604140 RepID=UPI0027E3ADBC|nr:methyl-accepting chemotaxis protein [Geminocystis sp. GBBB08]MBL1210706.1 HAMP domain-containing protein [Geminocystis sp. GBBB08]
MNKLQEETINFNFSETINILQNSVKENPSDLIAKLNLATALQQEKHYQEALKVYQAIIQEDTDGVFADTAEKAIAEIKIKHLTKEVKTEEKLTPQNQDNNQKESVNIAQKIVNLPIAYKQFIALFISSLISILGVVVAGRVITIILGRSQLENQAVAELAVSVINYNSRINEMESGFRGQSDNIAIIEAAKSYQDTGKIPPNLRETVRRILQNETNARQIEYSTLIGLDSKIIVNANKDRTGELFTLDNLVTEVLKFPRRLQTNAIISWDEISAEKPPLPSGIDNQDVLMNISFTPVINPQSQKIIGILMAGEVINNKTLFLRKTIEAVGGGYSAIYMFNDEKFQPVSSILQIANNDDAKTNIPLPELDLLKQAEIGTGGNLVSRMSIENKWHTVAVKALPNFKGEEIAFVVRGTAENDLQQLLNESLTYQILVGIFTLIIAIILAIIFGNALTKPIQKLQQTAQKIGAGDKNIRAKITSKDEVGQLALTFNEMAERIESYTEAIEDIAKQREKEAQFQKQQRENLQKNVINLLLDIEEASKGNLSVQAEVVSGEVGSIADAFNATIRSLQGLVKQVVISANQVNETVVANGQSVNHLVQNSSKQDQYIQSVGTSIEEITQSIEKVSESAQNAAQIARKSRLTAKEGENVIDETVNSIYQIRHTVADTSKKAKRLADSSQEISKIVSIISNISEKTNLLAFNASIEAARAGENGQGFRVVADEVRRLAEQVTFSTQEIEQLVVSIQEETSEMMRMMEESTTQVVTGTKLVKNTKETLQKLAQISNEIDSLLESISQSTVNQKLISQKVNEKMQEVAVVTKETAEESNLVSQSLQELVKVATEMQQSASRFQVS